MNELLDTIQPSVKDSFSNDGFRFETLREEDISWQLQNDIHRLLNIAYDGISKSFISKTYAYRRPSHRILTYQGDQLVGHSAIAETFMLYNGEQMRVGCIGLMASIAKKRICHAFLMKSIYAHREAGLSLATGYTSNAFVLRLVLPKIDCITLNEPTVGKNTITKSNAKTILFPLNLKKSEFDSVLSYIKQSKALTVVDEIF